MKPFVSAAALGALLVLLLGVPAAATAGGRVLAAASPQPADISAPGINLQDYRFLSKGVVTIETADVASSPQYLLGKAMAVAVVPTGEPIVSAVKFGNSSVYGRTVVFGHEGMLYRPQASNLGRLVRNAAAWVAGGKASGIRIAGCNSEVTDTAVAAIVATNPTLFRNVGTVDFTAISRTSVDVYIVDGQQEGAGKSAARIRAYVASGGGLVIAAQAWYYSYTNPVETHPTNLVIMPMGIILPPDVVYQSATLDPLKPPSQVGHLDVAQSCLEASFLGQTASPCYMATDDSLTSGINSLVGLARFLNSDMAGTASFWDRLSKWEAAATNSKTGIDYNKAITRRSKEGLGVLARTIRYKYLPPTRLPASPDAKFFPGLPTPGTKPILTPVSVTVKGTVVDAYWQCLGLYAMPGQAVNVTVPASLAALGTATLQVGGWTELLYHKTEWARVPEIVRSYTVTNTTTTVGSASGGLIYLIVPANQKLGNLQVQVRGAIRAPMYTAGSSSRAGWAAQLANPAPWGEIGSSKLVFASPKYSLSLVKDPAAVTTFWDKVQDANAYIAGIPTSRTHPMRFQHDADISAGYMAAGYPIVTYLDVANSSLTRDQGLWGQLHELGHNHQNGAWTWDCTVEVTCNFFAAHAGFSVRNLTNPDNFYGWSDNNTDRKMARAAYFARGASYQDLCGDAGLFLDSFLQLMELGGYGWKLFRETIASYKTLDQQPETDYDKMQTWVVQQSKVLNRNLSPYYRRWGWPLSVATQSKTSSFPSLNLPQPRG